MPFVAFTPPQQHKPVDRVQRSAPARGRPSTTAMAAPCIAGTPSSTSPLPKGTATPISKIAARQCASNASARSSRLASAASSRSRASPRRAECDVTAYNENRCWQAYAICRALSPLPDQRGRRHRALQQPLPLPLRGLTANMPPALGDPRRGPYRARFLILRAGTPHSAAGRLCPTRPKPAFHRSMPI